mgnify:CR=1 FL=1
MTTIEAQRRLSIALRQVDRELGYRAVCLVGTGKPVPRERVKPDPRDNDPIEWVEPIRVVVTDDPKMAPAPYNKGAHSYTYKVLAYLWVPSDAHASRLKKHLDEMLFGQKGKDMVHGWKDCAWWIAELLLGQAVQETGIEAFDEAERQRRREAALRKKRNSFRVKI